MYGLLKASKNKKKRKTVSWCGKKTVKNVICSKIDRDSLTLKYFQLSETLLSLHISTMVRHRCRKLRGFLRFYV